MSTSAAFLWRFLDDVWDLLPSDDRQLFESYWTGLLQISGNLESKIIEATLSPIMETVPLYLTERWNRFTMIDGTCDLLVKSDVLTLTGFLPTTLGAKTAFYKTFVLTNSTGKIPQSQQIEFFNDSSRSLRYGGIIANTVSVKIGPIEYTENIDYVVNYTDGTIQALLDGRIPIDQVTTVSYMHAAYVRGLDYEIDETQSTVARLSGTTISSGDQVTAVYTYNATPTLMLTGTGGSIPVGNDILRDASQDFSGLLSGRMLTVTAGPNAGVYAIAGPVSATEIAVTPNFPVTQDDGGVHYTIDAFPHGQRVSKNIASIPTLQNKIELPELVLQEGVDYVVADGILSSRAAFPVLDYGPLEGRVPTMWAEKTLINKETPYRNFGVLIDFYRVNSDAYKLALQGLWYTFWTGSTTGNLQRGLHILLGLPYARSAGTVVSLVPPTLTVNGSLEIEDARGQILNYVLPTGLNPTVAFGDAVVKFQSLTTGVKIIDRISEPGFVANRLGRGGIERFLTDNATRGPGDTDETKALTLLENHLFLPQVLTESVVAKVNVKELVTFLNNMKPQWTEFVFSFDTDEDETEQITEVFELTSVGIDASTLVTSNEENSAWEQGFVIDRATGETIAGGSQATGNFRDYGVDFSALGVDTGDYVRISLGTNKGYWQVLRRISSTVLSLSIPDVDLGAQLNLPYVVLPEEMLLGHDAIQLKRDNVILGGTAYAAPSVLNTKTNASFGALRNQDVQGLLLVDFGNIGNEVQVITAARVDLGEVTVAVPPSVGAATYQVASASVKRRDNFLATVTDAFAI